SEAEFGQYLVRIADEVAVGEKQELDQVERRRVPLPGFGCDQMGRRGFETYVSHVDIFLVFCYGNEMLCETIVRPGSNRKNHFSQAQYRCHRVITISGLEPRSKSGCQPSSEAVPTALHMPRDLYKQEKQNGGAVRPNARGDLVRW